MPREYALIVEEELTPQKALKFQVLTNFTIQIVFDSVIVVDASGQESELLLDYTLARWVESNDDGFTTEQDIIIDSARTKFNQGRGNKPKLPNVVKGNSEFARNFNRGNKLGHKLT